MRNRQHAWLGRLAAAATAAAIVGLCQLATGSAQAAPPPARVTVTPGCAFDSYCSAPLFSVEYGPEYFVADTAAAARRGNPVSLSWANDTNPGEDWHVTLQATVSALYRLGFIGAAMDLHYAAQPAVEVMWTPYGVTSNMCRGTAGPAVQGEPISLQPCGTFPETLWVVDPGDSRVPDRAYGGNALIAGSDRNPSVPYVMSAGGSGGDDPFAQLRVERLVADDGIPDPGQLWCTATESLAAAGPATFSARVPCFPDKPIGSVRS
jgi:hypothetical protein